MRWLAMGKIYHAACKGRRSCDAYFMPPLLADQFVGHTNLVGALLGCLKHGLRQPAGGLLVRMVLVHEAPVSSLHLRIGCGRFKAQGAVGAPGGLPGRRHRPLLAERPAGPEYGLQMGEIHAAHAEGIGHGHAAARAPRC